MVLFIYTKNESNLTNVDGRTNYNKVQYLAKTLDIKSNVGQQTFKSDMGLNYILFEVQYGFLLYIH